MIWCLFGNIAGERMYKLGENVDLKNTDIQPISETNVGANLVRPLTETKIKPMSDGFCSRQHFTLKVQNCGE